MNTLASAKRRLPLIFLGGLIAAVFAFGFDRYLSLEALRDNREALRALVDDHALSPQRPASFSPTRPWSLCRCPAQW
jgi:hypothetical protein